MGFQSAITGATQSVAGAAVASEFLREKRTNAKYERMAKEQYGEFMMGLNPEQRRNLMEKQEEAMKIVEKRKEAMQYQATAMKAHLAKLRGAEKEKADAIGHLQKTENLLGLHEDLKKLIEGGKK